MGVEVLNFVDNSPPQCDALYLNTVRNEINNTITQVGQSITTADTTQLGRAVTEYAAGGTFYTGGGVADAYVLSVVGTKLAPRAYFNGMSVRFVVPATNLTTTPTVNVAGIGVANIKSQTGGTIAANAMLLNTEVTLTYDGTNFRLTYGGFIPIVTSGTSILKGNGSGGVTNAVQGTDYYAPGGTGVAVADGGTGVSSLTAYGPIVGGTTSTGAVQTTSPGSAGQFFGSNGASAVPTMKALPSGSTTAAGVLQLATNAITNTGTSTSLVAPVSAMRYHPGSAKFWVNFNGTGTVVTNASNNVTNIVDNGTGDYTINFTTNFSSAFYSLGGMAQGKTSTFDQVGVSIKRTTDPTASALRITTVVMSNGSLVDCDMVTVTGHGTSA